MKMIPRLVLLGQLRRVIRVTGDGVEIDDRVVRLAGSNPRVQRLTLSFRVGRVGGNRSTSFERRGCGADHFQAASMRTVEELLMRRDELVRRQREIVPDVV